MFDKGILDSQRERFADCSYEWFVLGPDADIDALAKLF